MPKAGWLGDRPVQTVLILLVPQHSVESPARTTQDSFKGTCTEQWLPISEEASNRQLYRFNASVIGLQKKQISFDFQSRNRLL